MFTNIVFNYPNWLQQKDHETSIDTRPVIVRFSFGSRSLLVRSSFVSRSSLVAYSLVYRRPIEDRTRNKRKTNERATNVDRGTDENLSKTRRNATIMAGQTPFCSHKPAKCLLPQICRGRTLYFQCTLSIFEANKAISSIPWVSMVQPCRNPFTGFKCFVILQTTDRDNPLSTPKHPAASPTAPSS